MEQATITDWIPVDTFGARLALVRQRMEWNVKEAAEACGLPAASWRSWEHGASPRGMNEVARKIAAKAGCDYTWLAAGGPLADEWAPWGSNPRPMDAKSVGQLAFQLIEGTKPQAPEVERPVALAS